MDSILISIKNIQKQVGRQSVHGLVCVGYGSTQYRSRLEY